MSLFVRILRYIIRGMETDDDFECDSTWEDEDKNITSKTKSIRRTHRTVNAARDMQAFRHSCANLDNDPSDKAQGDLYNLKFYQGQIKSIPDGVFIHEFHKKWKGDYDKLERVTTFIQWLFPLQTQGVNPKAFVLTKTEIKLFRADEEVKSKLLESYKLMLDFYGIELVNEDTGEVKRAANWKDRFDNLNRHSSNNLRITRILKCLGTLGLQKYQTPLVKFFLDETLVKGTLQHVKQSVLDYFMFAVLDRSERKKLIKFAFKYFKPQEQFVWCPKTIQENFLKEKDSEDSLSGDKKQKSSDISAPSSATSSKPENKTSESEQKKLCEGKREVKQTDLNHSLVDTKSKTRDSNRKNHGQVQRKPPDKTINNENKESQGVANETSQSSSDNKKEDDGMSVDNGNPVAAASLCVSCSIDNNNIKSNWFDGQEDCEKNSDKGTDKGQGTSDHIEMHEIKIPVSDRCDSQNILASGLSTTNTAADEEDITIPVGGPIETTESDDADK